MIFAQSLIHTMPYYSFAPCIGMHQGRTRTKWWYALNRANLFKIALCNFFIPISLCNVCYKIISKIIANRLKIVLEKFIGSFQSAFVKGWMISYNYIIAHEILRSFKRRRKCKTMCIKLNMGARAYDRLEWDLIVAVLEAFGFTKSS